MKKRQQLILRTENLKPKMETDVKDFIDTVSAQEYVEGVVLLGGLGKRDFLDCYSDLDIAIFYDSSCTSLNPYLPFEFHATLEGTKYEFNIHQLFYDEEISREWDEGKREAYSRGIVLVDKKDRIEKLIKTKTAFDRETAYCRLVYIMQQYVWRGQTHSLRTFHRGFPEGSHDLLNECVDLLIEAVYILNENPRPHKKWRIAMLTTMENVPTKFFDNLRESMRVLDFSLEDIQRRILALNQLYAGINRIVREQYPDFPKKPYEYYYKRFYQPQEECFAQKVAREMSAVMSDEEVEELEGKLCLNLVFDESALGKFTRKG